MPLDATLTSLQSTGLLHCPDSIDPSDVASARRAFWSEITDRFGIDPDDPATWTINDNQPQHEVRARRLSGMNPVMNALTESGALDEVLTAIQRKFDAIYGPNLWVPASMWYSLLNFPGSQTEWNVPNRSWHADEPIVAGEEEPWSLFVFVFLDTVEHGGGATVVVTGSNRCAQFLAERDGKVDPTLIRAFESTNAGLVDPDTARAIAPTEVVPALAAENEWVRDLLADGPPKNARNNLWTDAVFTKT